MLGLSSQVPNQSLDPQLFIGYLQIPMFVSFRNHVTWGTCISHHRQLQIRSNSITKQAPHYYEPYFGY
jgi:hypothetical protein